MVKKLGLVTINRDPTPIQIAQFLKSAGSSVNSFRYFDSRPVNKITEHVATLLLMLQSRPIGYGHLDQEGNDTWLGIAVQEQFIGNGFGRLIMQELVSIAVSKGLSSIVLSVDKNNFAALKLYESFNFKFLRFHTEEILILQLDL